VAKKPQEIRELAQSALTGVMQSRGTWLSYLQSLGNLYKYSFPDTLLIHAQHPGTVAVASHDVWQGIFGRYNNRGSKGIALIDDAGDKCFVKYVYAFEDTNSGRLPYIWRLGQQHHSAVLNALKSEHSLKASSLENALLKACYIKGQEVAESQMPFVLDNPQGSVLEQYDASMVSKCFTAAVVDSSACAVFSRAGIDLSF
jgi:hypothetical protein